MEAAHTSAPTSALTAPTDLSSNGERRCLVSGELRPKSALIRFVIGPDRSVVADLAGNLPGRGLWVTAERQALTLAARKNFFAKAAQTAATVKADLADQVVALLQKRCLDMLGLARRAGVAVLGQPQVEAALKNRQLDLLLLADDAGRDQTGLTHADIPISRRFTRHELGAALGHEQLVYVGLRPHALTAKLCHSLTLAETLATPTPPCDKAEEHSEEHPEGQDERSGH